MMMVASAKLSARGQLVIPQDLRRELNLKPGDSLLCSVREGKLVLVPMNQERDQALEDFFAWGRRIAKINKLKKRDVQRWVDEVRYGKK